MSEAAPLFSDGKAYERNMGRFSRLAGEKFVRWLGAPKGLRWLDVGCGNGAFTEVLIEHCAPSAVVGIDPSEGQLAYARTRPGTRLAEFRVGDAQSLPFADNSFDAATMALVIVFIADPAKAVAEMMRVVRPGGFVATYMWDFPGGGFPLQPFLTAIDSLGVARQASFAADYSRRERLRTLWEEGGLASVDTELFRTPVVFADFDDFWESNSLPNNPLGRAIDALAPDVKEQLKARLREQLPMQRDGKIAYEAFANAVKGKVPQ